MKQYRSWVSVPRKRNVIHENGKSTLEVILKTKIVYNKSTNFITPGHLHVVGKLHVYVVIRGKSFTSCCVDLVNL